MQGNYFKTISNFSAKNSAGQKIAQYIQNARKKFSSSTLNDKASKFYRQAKIKEFINIKPI